MFLSQASDCSLQGYYLFSPKRAIYYLADGMLFDFLSMQQEKKKEKKKEMRFPLTGEFLVKSDPGSSEEGNEENTLQFRPSSEFSLSSARSRVMSLKIPQLPKDMSSPDSLLYKSSLINFENTEGVFSSPFRGNPEVVLLKPISTQ